MKNVNCKLLNSIGMTALMGILTLMWGCSSDGGDGGNGSNGGDGSNAITFVEVSERPDWKIDHLWHDEMPDWQNPNATLYEERMYVTLKLDEEFVPYSTPDDRMAIFIGGECRGVSKRNVSEYDSNSILFPIMVLGNRQDAEEFASLTVKYYCGGMKQIFNNPSLSRFSPDAIVGGMWDTVFPFDGGEKYKIYRTINVQMKGDVPFDISNDDIMAAFIDGECRGVGHANSFFQLWLTSDEEVGKTIQLRYYCAEKGGIYTLQEPIQVPEGYFLDVKFNF